MKHKYLIFTLLIAVVTITSCRETWDEHYGMNGKKSDLNLLEYIESQPDLSKFSEMLKISGYDTIINKSQTYTVWAPVNSSLADLDLNDTKAITNIVKNHISRFSNPTSGIDSKIISMVSKKYLTFRKADAGFTFGGKTLVEANTATVNGILHKVDGYVTYTNNIWEFIGNTPGLDSLRNYLYSQSIRYFDQEASIEIGTDSQNLAIYDSVIIFSNPVLDKIGQLHLEDSLYAAILPTNTAWKQVYNSIKSKYKTVTNDGGVKQRLYTQSAIVENMIFRMKDRNFDPIIADSLVSSIGSVFKQSGDLFLNSTKYSLSNGLAYVTDSLRYKPEESWQKPIRIEAENSNYGRSFANTNLATKYSFGTSYNVSEDKFLVSEPTSTATQNSVIFPIPNVLSGKYKISCVFVPSSIVNADDARLYQTKFYLSYINSKGVPTESAIVKNKVSAIPGQVATTYTTDSLVITKMFVAEFTFPFCNLLTKESTVSEITTKLKIENAAPTNKPDFYDRDLRIDYIILEPVQ